MPYTVGALRELARAISGEMPDCTEWEVRPEGEDSLSRQVRGCNSEVTGVTLPGMEAKAITEPMWCDKCKVEPAVLTFVDGRFCGKCVPEGPWVQPAVEASDAWPWLSKVQTSLAEARRFEGPLNGRKMLADLQKLIDEVRRRAWDLNYARGRADGADAEVTRLVKENEELRDAAAEPNERLMALAGELGKAQDQIACLKTELATEKAKKGVPEWLIWDPNQEEWWLSPGEGYTHDRAKAHRYTWSKAKLYAPHCPVLHESEPTPPSESKTGD